MVTRLSIMFLGLALLAACSEEPPPRTVTDFIDNPIVLEAAMVRCAEDRSQSRYDAECVNAREAVKIIEAKEDQARRAELERLSERKRQALRRTQQAAAEARRRAAEAERRREEAEYLGQFGELPADSEADAEVDETAANAPSAIVPENQDMQPDTSSFGDSLPAGPGSNAPGVETEPASDLDAIREELRQRADGPGDP